VVGLGPSAVGAPSAAPTVKATDLGVVRWNPVIKGRDGGYSGLVGGRSVWVFGDTVLSVPGTDGDSWSDNTVSSTGDLDGSDGISLPQDLRDSTGAPVEFMPLTGREAEYNRAHRPPGCKDPCGAEFVLWPGALVPDPAHGRALVFFAEIWRVVGQPGWRTLGEGVAIGSLPGGLVRPIVRPGERNPTLLFTADQPPFGVAATVAGDLLYTYGCYTDFLSKPCDVARVPLADVLDLGAWQYLTAAGTWSPDLADAAPAFDGGSIMSVAWNGYLSSYLAVYSKIFDDRVAYRTAPSPEGPWSEEAIAFTGKPGVGGSFDYSGLAHTEYQQDGGRLEYVTYVRAVAPFQSEMRLVQLDFGAPG
jgi:Domain of unknown function (DUF4185)